MANPLSKPRQQLSNRYVFVTLLVSLIGFLIFAGILTVFLKEYYNNEVELQLKNISVMARNIVIENLNPDVEIQNFIVDHNKINKGFLNITLENTTDITIMVADNKENIFIVTGIDKEQIMLKGISGEIEIDSDKPAYLGQISMGTNYGENIRHFYVNPILLGDESKEVLAYVFVTKTEEPLKAFLNKFYKIYFLIMLGVLAMIFTVVTLALDKVMTPLAEMALVTRSFAKGDFAQRVPIYGNGSDELSHLSIAFNNMASSLDSHEQTRKSFIANVSHELKTPMTSIGGFVDGILDGTITKDRETYYLKIVSGEIKRLSRMVVSMLNISKIEAGELQIHPNIFDINQTVIQTVFAFEQRINAKKLEIIGLDVKPQMVFADADMIHQVVYNIVDNAIKFVNDDGYLEFRYEREKKNILIGIRNSGEGLSAMEISQIFDRFYKVDRSRGVNRDGVGLGLYIVRTIVNLHDGEIIVNSVEGEYTEFIFSLPDESRQWDEKFLVHDEKTNSKDEKKDNPN